MRITDVNTILLTGPCTNDPFLTKARKLRSAAFIEIKTDTEHVGLGETYAGYFCPELVPQIVDFFKPILLEKGIDDIGELWRQMYHCGNFWCRVGVGASVLTGIEAALWDLKGKLESRPAYELLGGTIHAALPCYATGGPAYWPKDMLLAQSDFYMQHGFRGLKVGAGAFSPDKGPSMPDEVSAIVDLEAAKAQALREHLGPDVAILMDGHMGNSPTNTWTLDVASKVMKALEPFDLFLYEEPLHYTDLTGYESLCKMTSVQIAGGECLSAPCEWQPFITRNAFDIGQPDASFIGGLEPFVEVANQLAAHNRKIATHAWGAGGSLMQNIHAGFACPNTAILEIPPAYGPLHSEVINDSLRIIDGKVLPPDKPGLGIELSQETRSKFKFHPGSGEFNSVPGKILRD